MDESVETKMRDVTVILNNLAADFQREQYDDRPTIPSTISRSMPSPILLMVLLPMKPATKPNRIQAR